MDFYYDFEVRRFRGRKRPETFKPRVRFDESKISMTYDDFYCSFLIVYDCAVLGSFVPWGICKVSRRVVECICHTYNFKQAARVLRWIRCVWGPELFAPKHGRRR